MHISNKNIFSFLTLFVVFSSTIFTSCVNTKKITYFSNVTKDTTFQNTSQLPISYIAPSDILTIGITSLNPQASSIFNNLNATNTGIIVDSAGYIQLPFLGNMKAEGMTINQLKGVLTKQLVQKELLVDPIVTIHYLNFKVTVLGEVSRPLVINVPNEKISILEAIGLAGDLTVFGKRSGVLVIRENETGQKTFKRLDLNSSEIFRSPFYYLKTNDVVYIEPTGSKLASISRTPQIITYVLSGLSLALIIIQLLK